MEKTAEQLRREHIALEGDTHGKNKWAILFTVLIMTFMVCLDSTVVTVALPVMQKELGVGLDRIQLVSSVYLLAVLRCDAALWCDAACGAGGGRSVVDYRTMFINRAVSLPREGVAPCRSLRTVFAMTAS